MNPRASNTPSDEDSRTRTFYTNGEHIVREIREVPVARVI
jgi:hypothetical protein